MTELPGKRPTVGMTTPRRVTRSAVVGRQLATEIMLQRTLQAVLGFVQREARSELLRATLDATERAVASADLGARHATEEARQAATLAVASAFDACAWQGSPSLLGIEPEAAGEQPAPAAGPSEPASAEATSADAGPSRPRQPRTGTKQEMLIGMLRRPQGAMVPEVVEATGRLAHTVRGALRKHLGLEISSEKVGGRGRVHRIGGRGLRTSAVSR